MSEPLRVGVFGAGAVGGYLGVLLSAAGTRVRMVGRQALLDKHASGKPMARDLRGQAVRPGDDLEVALNCDVLRDVDVCLVTVKASATKAAAAALAPMLSATTPVVSMQNGLHNADVLRAGGLTGAVSGMIAFNLIEHDGEIAQATSGPLMVGGGQRPALMHRLAAAFAAAGQKLDVRDDMPAVLAAKLLINLNNGICCVSGTSIASSIASRDLRRSYAACIREGINAFRHADMPVVRIGKLAPALIARMLPLPNFLVRVLARPMVRIDPRARSSTLQDLEAGKATEIDTLNGEIVRIAKQHGQPHRVNEFVVGEVKRLEAAGPARRYLSASEVWQAVRAAL